MPFLGFCADVFRVHPQNVRFQNVRFQNVRFQNVWNVRFTKRQVYKTSGLQNVRFTKRQVFITSGCKKIRLQKNTHKYSVLVVGGNSQVMLQPYLQAKWWLCFIFCFSGFFVTYHHIWLVISKNDKYKYFLFNKYIKFKILDVLKPDVLKPDVL